jgi:hypothetical protein
MNRLSVPSSPGQEIEQFTLRIDRVPGIPKAMNLGRYSLNPHNRSTRDRKE